MQLSRIGAFVVTGLLLLGGCRQQMDVSASVVGLGPSSVTLRVEAEPGTHVVERSAFGDDVVATVGDSGSVTFVEDLSQYDGFIESVHVNVEREELLTEYWGSVEVGLPMPVSMIKQLPSMEQGFGVLRAAGPGGEGFEPISFGADGRADLAVATNGASAVSLDGQPITLNAVGMGTGLVDFTAAVLNAKAISGGTVTLTAQLSEEGGTRQVPWQVELSAEQTTAILDKWLAQGAPTARLTTSATDGLLWRRRTNVRLQEPYALVGDNESPGVAWVADEVVEREDIRSCVYMKLIGLNREVIVRDVRTGQEIGRRTFEFDRRRARCPAVVYQNQSDHLFFEDDDTIRQWLQTTVAGD